MKRKYVHAKCIGKFGLTLSLSMSYHPTMNLVENPRKSAGLLLAWLSLLAMLAAACSTSPAPRVEPDAWAMFRGGPHNPGAATATLQPPLHLVELIDTGSRIRSTIAANGPYLYVGDWDGMVHAVDLVEQRWLWQAKTADLITGSPTLVHDRLVIGSCDSTIYAFDLGDGRELWRYRTGDMVISSPQLAGDRIICGSSDGNVYAIDWRSGRLAWQFDTGGIVTSTAAVVEDRVYIGTGAPALFCLRAQDGEPLWMLPVERGIVASPLYAAGLLYFGDYAGVFRAVDPDSGTVRWQVLCPEKIDASATFANGMVFWVDMAGIVHAAVAATGEPLWQFPMGGPAVSSPLVDPEHIVVARYRDGRLYLLRQSNGEPVWHYGFQAPVYASPVLHRGRLYVGTEDGKLYAFAATPVAEPVYLRK